MTTPKLTPLERHAVDLLLRSICADDDDRARALARQAAEALVDVARAAWGKRIELASSLLDEAERHLNQAEATDDPEQRAQCMQRFEELMSAAEAAKSNARPRPRQVH